MIITALNAVVLTLYNNNLRLLSLSLSLVSVSSCCGILHTLGVQIRATILLLQHKMDPLSVHKYLYYGTLVHSNHFVKVTIMLITLK